LLEPSEPETTVTVRRSASGRIRTYDLGSFSDSPVVLTHSLIKQPEIDAVIDFWRANRGQLFNVEDHLGDYWVAAFLGKPQKVHVDGLWYDLIVKLVRYDPAEGGL
jgi:hypothetical protein